MKENVKEFLELLKTDKELESVLKQALEGLKTEEQVAVVIKIAREKGFDLCEEDLNPDGQEISLDELDNVAGGFGVEEGCTCILIGGGSGTDSNDGKTYGCACVVYGQGGDGSANDANCFCPTGGEGTNGNQWF